MDNYTVKISELPKTIQDDLPYSILTFKNEYNIGELPDNIQYLIKEYFKFKKDIEYKKLLLDFKPNISVYGDFDPIQDYYDLVAEYFKNYLLIQTGQYPFDPTFGSSLKKYIFKKDASLQNILISSEVKKIAQNISDDLNISIVVKSMKITKNTSGIDAEYNIFINLKINNNSVKLNLQV